MLAFSQLGSPHRARTGDNGWGPDLSSRTEQPGSSHRVASWAEPWHLFFPYVCFQRAKPVGSSCALLGLPLLWQCFQPHLHVWPAPGSPPSTACPLEGCRQDTCSSQGWQPPDGSLEEALPWHRPARQCRVMVKVVPSLAACWQSGPRVCASRNNIHAPGRAWAGWCRAWLLPLWGLCGVLTGAGGDALQEEGS